MINYHFAIFSLMVVMGFRLKKSLLLYQSKNEGYKNKEVAICAIKKSYINFGPKKMVEFLLIPRLAVELTSLIHAQHFL